MKVFVCTKATQGLRRNDYCWVPEGELLMFGWECDRDHHPDGECGCKRGLIGMECSRATTTFAVSDQPITDTEFISRYLETLRRAGWLRPGNERQFNKAFIADAREILALATRFQVGDICEKRGDQIRLRQFTHEIIPSLRT